MNKIGNLLHPLNLPGTVVSVGMKLLDEVRRLRPCGKQKGLFTVTNIFHNLFISLILRYANKSANKIKARIESDWLVDNIKALKRGNV